MVPYRLLCWWEGAEIDGLWLKILPGSFWEMFSFNEWQNGFNKRCSFRYREKMEHKVFCVSSTVRVEIEMVLKYKVSSDSMKRILPETTLSTILPPQELSSPL
jgi:hypothetical protein